MLSTVQRTYKAAFAITFGLFALWGVGRCLYDTLVIEFAKVFALNGQQIELILCLYSLLYFLFAVPAALYARVLGTKAAVVFGLGTWSVGAFLFYPAAQEHVFVFFLIAAIVMSLGYIFVEISVNHIVAGMGSPERTPLRLNFAHAVYPVGVVATLFALRWLNLADLALPIQHLSNVILRPYMVIGAVVLLFAFFVDNTRFPAFATERSKLQGGLKEFRTLLSRPMILAAIGAQCCSVAALVGIWMFNFWYVETVMPGTSPAAAGDYVLVSIIIFAIGRLVGAFLMLRFRPERLLALFSLSGVVLGTIAIFAGGSLGVYALIACSFSTSILFATILGLAIRDLGPLAKTGTALVYIGGSGSAIGIAAMHLVWANSSIQLAMLVPTLCYAGVLAFALAHGAATTAEPASPTTV